MMACTRPPTGALMAMAPASQTPAFSFYLTSAAGAAHAADDQIDASHRGRATRYTARPAQLALTDEDGMYTATSE